MSSIPIPSKGDIITIENKQYRVLKVSGTVVEVLAMYDAGTQAVNATSKTVIFTGGKSGQQYKDSDLDTYLNETFFATLSATMQEAIVPKDINQDMWDYTASSSTTSGTYYNQKYGSNNRYYYDSNYGTAEVGSRNVYVLSIRDVIDYLNVPANGVFTDTDIWQMFWNDNTKHREQYLWLRSAYRYDETYVFYVSGGVGYMDSYLCSRPYRVRPVFQIDWDILYPSTPTLTFKHFYDAGTIGSGTVKFRHYSQQEPSSGGTVEMPNISNWTATKVSGDFAGTLTLYTTNNGGNKIQCGPKGYEWIPKINDGDILIPFSDVASVFGITQDSDGNNITSSEWDINSAFDNRVTNDGLDGGSCIIQIDTNGYFSGSTSTDVRVLVYDANTDTMRVDTCEIDEKLGYLTTKYAYGFNQIFCTIVRI